MGERMKLATLVALIVLTVSSAMAPAAAPAQFTPLELAERDRWEAFLKDARVVGAKQFGAEEAVTEPWKLHLEKDGVTRYALWKNPSGTQGEFLEGWRYEIAAYNLDKLLGVGMVPPTVEKRFRGQAGSCQLWIDDTIILFERIAASPDDEAFATRSWRRAVYLAQVFDNLIGNEDRHRGNVLVTADNRNILIDHSRTFRTTKEFTESIPFNQKTIDDAQMMRELPRALVDKVRSLTEAEIKSAVGKYLTTKEIRAIMARRALLLAEIDRLIAKYGEDSVLY